MDEVTAPVKKKRGDLVAEVSRRTEVGVARWVAKVMGAGLGMSVSLNLVLAGVVVSQWPLKQLVPAFMVTQDHGRQVVRVESDHITRDVRDNFTESTLRHYVEARETINGIDDVSRWIFVGHLTDPVVFNGFLDYMSEKNPKSPALYYKDHKMTRAVETTRASGIPDSDAWQVEFVTTDRDKAGAVVGRPRSWVATIAFEKRDEVMSYEGQFINPLGIYVVDYALSERTVQ